MQAIEILMQEHRVIETVLDSLETAADRLSRGHDVPMDFFLTAADFLRNFADGCHHQKEEGILFVALATNGMSREAEPLSIFLEEHEEGRRLTRGMLESAERIRTGNMTETAQLVQHVMDYVTLLREHIHKEDHVLFPMADDVLPAGEHQQLIADFKRIEDERQICETYLRIADELARVWGT